MHGSKFLSTAGHMDYVKATSLSQHGDDRFWFSNAPDDHGGAMA